MPFTSTINPVLLHVGPLEIRYYGLVYALGFLFAVPYLKWAGRKGILNLSDDDVYDLVFYMMIGTLVGGRLFSTLVWYPSYYLANPLEIFMIWKGGMAFHGSFIGVVLAAWWGCREKGIPLGRLLDVSCIPFVFFLGLGRIANFTNGELYGPVTNVSWCVNFPNVEGCRHPYQIYSALKRFLMMPLLILLYRRPHKDGFVFVMMGLMFGAGRFVLDFWREDVLYYRFSVGQWSSILVFVIFGFIALNYYRDDLKGLLLGRRKEKSSETL